MDPAACVARILSLIAYDDADEAQFACADLRAWLSRGGFAPHGWTPAQCAAFLTMAYATCDGLRSK